MKKSGKRLFNFGIPAYKSEDGTLTCPSALTCIANCYARQGTYNFPVVKKAYENRFQATLKDDFINKINTELIKNKVAYLRIHDSGDFYSREYLHKWLKIMDDNKDVIFYAYTKSYSFFENLSLPKNFIVIYSQGSKEKLNKEYRHAQVFESIEDMEKMGYVDAGDDDLNAIGANKNIGLLYHGNKKVVNNGFTI